MPGHMHDIQQTESEHTRDSAWSHARYPADGEQTHEGQCLVTCMISSRRRANTRGTVPDHNFMYDIQQMESGHTRDSATKLWSGTVPVSALRLLDIIHVTRQTDSKHTGQGLMMLDLVLPVQGLEARAFTHKGCINTVLLFKTLTLCLPDVMNNPSPL